MTEPWDALSLIEAARDLAAIKQAVRNLIQPLGYDRIVVFSITARQDELVECIYWVEGDWFETGEAVDALTYVRRCPVTQHVLDTDQPFFWTKTRSEQGASYRTVSVPQGSGVHGIQVPVFGHAGLEGAVSFGGKRIDATARTRQTLTLLATVAFQAARRLVEDHSPTRMPKLSAREREILRWVGAGRRIADIASALGLSERTIENHLRRIRQRLQVTTTAQAVQTAIRSGDIVP
jgi:LuxR family transcriptional regulator, quorum-sensing system regulator BjaR1